jgi:hypothetical protein
MNDTVGKPFLVLRDGLRRCLGCDELFTQQEAPQHAQVPCFPVQNASTERKCELRSTPESRR